MSDESTRVKVLVTEAGIPLMGSVIKDARPGNHYFAIVAISRDTGDRQEPSQRRLDEVRAELAAQGLEVQFVLGDPQTIDVEGGLRAALRSAYGDATVAVAVALRAKKATVWVEMGDAVMTPALIEAVHAKVVLYFASFDVNDLAIQITPRANLPSILACLRIIRQLAPVSNDALAAKLAAGGFNVPSAEWLSHRLDSMRRTGRIVRLRDGTYTLTADALRKLGTSKLRSSPDVVRMLALARGSR